jgi:hypothetical protein
MTKSNKWSKISVQRPEEKSDFKKVDEKCG